MSLVVLIETTDEPSTIESASIENISEHGARIVSGRHWQVSDRLIVSDSLSGFRAVGEVVYCQPMANNRLFAMGLRFSPDVSGLCLSGIPPAAGQDKNVSY